MSHEIKKGFEYSLGVRVKIFVRKSLKDNEVPTSPSFTNAVCLFTDVLVYEKQNTGDYNHNLVSAIKGALKLGLNRTEIIQAHDKAGELYKKFEESHSSSDAAKKRDEKKAAQNKKVFLDRASVQIEKIHKNCLAAREIIKNAKKLVPATENVWKEILEKVARRYTYGKQQDHRGETAIANTVAGPIRHICDYMEWKEKLNSPEIIYLSGFYFLSISASKRDSLDEQINAINDGTRVFLDEEKKNEALEKERKDLFLISAFHDQMEKALAEYKKCMPESDPKYLEVLQKLIYFDYAQMKKDGIGNDAMDYLKKGFFDEALDKVSAVKKD